MDEEKDLSRRERQIMNVVYAFGEATATEVTRNMPDPPTRTSVRTFLRILEEKGHLSHTKRSREFVYKPTRPRKRAGQSAMNRVIGTFFDGSLAKAVSAHLADPGAKLQADDLKHLEDLVRHAREKGE